ncbi:hypothetical protein KW842_22290 [Duganella sp. sic0402]|uniref:hypothetical protein n=1 Tax=Duganella sp. sic0402 TaxID=2854786 RepID=UPI001C464876|nr:hypothetical protein [Duganella sp. sic0402]MBV7538510.1 hypothetical protein [Duganella sp. sic0402]
MNNYLKRFPALVFILLSGVALAAPIDRQALVQRHNPQLKAIDPWAPLSVGNGQFCFTADVTGLQTFPEHYSAKGIALETQARWSWHEDPNPNGYKLADANRDYTAHGQTVGYPTIMTSPAALWLRANPHVWPLGQLSLRRGDGSALSMADIRDVDQKLDLWKGVLTSRYTVDGQPVSVMTAVSPGQDTLAVRIQSPLLASGKLAVRLALPRGYDMSVKHNPPLDWTQPESHSTRVLAQGERSLVLEHARDAARYGVALQAGMAMRVNQPAPHTFQIAPAQGAALDFTLSYALATAAEAPDAAAVIAQSTKHWQTFWRSGAALDFSGSSDPRAAELERRVVLSQYLTAIQFGGDFPPQESGLTTTTWFGKHHTEMLWWHTAHFALWGRPQYLENALRWHQKVLPVARQIAQSRGLEGARWPKMTGPGGRESPGGNPLIVWNQPHLIHLAELLYRAAPTPQTLERYRELVFATADAMSSMLHWDGKRYVLGPPLWIAQEIYDQSTSMNPAYELSYWSTGLALAQQWRVRLGLAPNPAWEKQRLQLSALPQKDGKYVALESTPDTWDNVASRHDHPSFLMALGQLPGAGVDRAVMRRTLDAVLSDWDFHTKIWGWDYPMIAMTAARLDAAQQAVDVLLKTDGPNNSYTAAGHNPNTGLPVYLPGNGALLAAVAMMAGGWDGAPQRNAPGFPQQGWKVRAEGFQALP